MKNIIKGFGLASVLVLMVGAVATGNLYRGTFVGSFTGNGAGITNMGGTFTGSFTGNGAGLTNVPNTNYNAGMYVASTNGSVNNSLAVTATSGDGIRLAVRGFTAQTNDVLQVQTAVNGLVFGVDLSGCFKFADVKTNATMGSNTVLYMVITNKGVGYVIPLHALTD